MQKTHLQLFGIFAAIFIFKSCQETESKKEDPIITSELIEIIGPTTKGIIDTIGLPQYIRNDVATIANHNYFSNGVAGKGGEDETKIPPYFTFINLKKEASVKDLYQLTFNKSDVIALYAYLALSEKIPNLAPTFYKRLLDKNTSIYSQRGCLIGDVKTSELYYDELLVDDENTPRAHKINRISLSHKNATQYIRSLELRKQIHLGK